MLIVSPKMLPLNIQLLNVDDIIVKERILEVSSSFIHEPSSTSFHPEGLFSERIFGQIATVERLIKFGYVSLHTEIFHPLVYINICRLKPGLYEEILAGKQYAKFDQEAGDFVAASVDDELARTGFSFFLEHFHQIKFVKNNSLTRNDRIRIIERYRDLLTLKRWLILPAGIRDMNIETAQGKAGDSDINSLYLSLMNFSKAIPTQNNDHPVYDNIRFSIQKKIVEIYEYLSNLLDDKGGFLQRKYGARNIALGTANVISAASMAASSPDDPRYLKSNETKLPLFQSAKAFQPIVTTNMKLLFFNHVFDSASDQISVIDPETLTLKYQPITLKEKDRFLSSDGLIGLINQYQDDAVRHNPVVVHNDTGQRFWLFLVYDEGDEIYYFRNITEFQHFYEQLGKVFDRSKVRSLVYSELLYVATYRAVFAKHEVTTRYPVLHVGSTYSAKIHLMSTDPARTIKVKSVFSDLETELPEYPIIGKGSIDSLVLHPTRLSNSRGLGADFDGDRCTASGVISDEANEENANYLNSLSCVMSPRGTLSFGADSDLVALTFYNFSVKRSA